MRHYRGFNEQLGFIGPPGAPTVTSGGIPVVAYTSTSGWAARPIQATEYYQPPTVVAIPPSADISPLPPERDWGDGGIPGDIRPITERLIPGEAIVDEMATENGVPGVDYSGAFPYGDPRAEKAAATPAAGNAGLIIAAILAALVLGG